MATFTAAHESDLYAPLTHRSWAVYAQVSGAASHPEISFAVQASVLSPGPENMGTDLLLQSVA